jgi:hypothetical protein
MKKLLAIVVLGLLWNGNGNANTDMPTTFFGIKLGSKISDYTSNNCYLCADGKSKLFNRYNLNPKEPNKDFTSYKALTTAKTKLIAAILIKGDFVYDDFQGDNTTHLNTCRSEQDNLLIAIQKKYKKDFPKLTVVKGKDNLSIIGENDTISVSLTCKPIDPDPEWKFYKKEGMIFSSKYFNLSEKENTEIGLGKTNSSGF